MNPSLLDTLRTAILVEPWPAWAGGLGIGLFVVAFYALRERMFGVSTGLEDACSLVLEPAAARRPSAERVWLLVGIVLGGALAVALGGGAEPDRDRLAFEALWGPAPLARALVLAGGGLLVGFGARFAGGCTSGHAIVGTSLLAPASWVATAGFMAGGFATTALVAVLLGAP